MTKTVFRGETKKEKLFMNEITFFFSLNDYLFARLGERNQQIISF
jgi:hypothetical protein